METIIPCALKMPENFFSYKQGLSNQSNKLVWMPTLLLTLLKSYLFIL